jgi:hypothetical protein
MEALPEFDYEWICPLCGLPYGATGLTLKAYVEVLDAQTHVVWR